MSRTNAHKPKATTKFGKKKRYANNLGICMCKHCKLGRRGNKDSAITKIKNSLRHWWNNKPEKHGAYTD